MNYNFAIFIFVSIGCLYVGHVRSKNEGKTWALLIASYPYYPYTYGMEGAVYKMYDTLVRGGTPKENIIVISPDVVAYHRSNINPGSVLYAHNTSDVYSGYNYYDDVVIDYSSRLKVQDFMDILQGNETNTDLKLHGSGRLIKSEPNDNIFIYFQGFVVFGGLILHSGYVLYPEELIPFLEDLKESNKFNKLFWHLECNRPGYMFDDYLDTDKNILIYALGGRYNEFTACHFSSALNAYTSICSSSMFHKYLDEMLATNGGKETIFDTFINARYTDWENYETIHNFYGEIPAAKEQMKTYFGPSHKPHKKEINFESLRQEAKSLIRTPLREAALNDEDLLSTPKREQLKQTLHSIIESSVEGTNIPVQAVLRGKFYGASKEHRKCATKVTGKVFTKCSDDENRFAMIFESEKLTPLCSLGIPQEKILSSIDRHC